MKMVATLLVVFTASIAFSKTVVRTGQIHRLGKATGAPLFTQTSTIVTDGTTETNTSQIVDADGKVVMKEVSKLQNGKVVSQQMDQLQISERYELTVTDGKATFKTFSLKERAPALMEEKTVEAPTDLVTGPGTEAYLMRVKTDLLAGKTPEADFGIFELQKPIRFAFEPKNASAESADLELKMKISSFWLGFVVDPIHMTLNRETFQMTRFQGRTPVRTFNGKKWEPLDADITYSQIEVAEGTKK